MHVERDVYLVQCRFLWPRHDANGSPFTLLFSRYLSPTLTLRLYLCPYLGARTCWAQQLSQLAPSLYLQSGQALHLSGPISEFGPVPLGVGGAERAGSLIRLG